MAAEADQVREDMLTLRSALKGFSFQGKCGLLGVSPRESGLCVRTAAGPGGAVVPVRVEPQPHVSSSYPTNALYKQDEVLAKTLQQEENDLAAHEANFKDAELAASLTPKAGVQTPPSPAPRGKRRAGISTAQALTTTAPAHTYRPGTWGKRFAALDACPQPSHPLQEATPAPAAPG